MVAGKARDAVGAGLGAEAQDDGPWAEALDRLQQQVRGAEQRVGGPAVRALDALGEREERAVEQRRSVDCEQRRGGGAGTGTPYRR